MIVPSGQLCNILKVFVNYSPAARSPVKLGICGICPMTAGTDQRGTGGIEVVDEAGG